MHFVRALKNGSLLLNFQEQDRLPFFVLHPHLTAFSGPITVPIVDVQEKLHLLSEEKLRAILTFWIFTWACFFAVSFQRRSKELDNARLILKINYSSIKN